VFPVRYELDFYISLRQNSVFKGLIYGENNIILYHMKFELESTV
jgi:hypothetical protein